jgi:hypothetical protein
LYDTTLLSPKEHCAPYVIVFMNVRKDNQKFDPEQTLNATRLGPVDSHALDSAKTRVWNQLSHSIHQEQLPMTQSTPEQTAPAILPKPGLWQRYHKSFLTAGVIALLVISTTGTVALLGYQKGGKNKQADTVAVNTADKPAVDFKLLAASRFKQLNGIAYEEVKTVFRNDTPAKGASGESMNLDRAAAPTPNVNPAVIDQKVVDSSKAQNLVKRLDQEDKNVFYTEQQVSVKVAGDEAGVINSYFNTVTGKHPLIDYSQPVTLKTWNNSLFTKTTLSQNGKLVYFNLTQNTATTTYMGGAYAVQTAYDTPIYLAGMAFSGRDSVVSPEMSFLNYILENKEAKQLGEQTVDGKKLLVIEISNEFDAGASDLLVSGPAKVDAKENTSKTSTRYYVEIENFKLYMTETYKDGRLVQIIKTTDEKVMTNDDTFQNTKQDELKNITVKKVELKDTSVSAKMAKIADLAKHYSVYYNPTISPLLDSAFDADLTHTNQSDDASKLLNSKEFNPLYSAPTAPSYTNYSIASYSQSSLRYEIYNDEPKNEQADSSIKQTITDTTVTIDGKEYKAKFIERTISKPTSDKPVIAPDSARPEIALLLTNAIVFKGEDGKWYQISEFTTEENTRILSKTGLKLMKLTVSEAIQIDRQVEEKSTAYPQVQMVKLTEIQKSSRILPGDMSKVNDLKARAVYKSTKKGSETKCDKYYLETALLECIVEKYDGFRISFSSVKNGDQSGEPYSMIYPSTRGSGSIEFLVLETKGSTINPLLAKTAPAYIEKFGPKNTNYLVQEIKGKTVVVWGAVDKTELAKFAVNADFDKDLDTLSKQVEEMIPTIRPDGNGGQSIPGSSGSGWGGTEPMSTPKTKQ